MGQAQRIRQQGVRYQEVELELWELDADDDRDNYGGRRRRSDSGRRTGSGSRVSGSRNQAGSACRSNSRNGGYKAGSINNGRSSGRGSSDCRQLQICGQQRAQDRNRVRSSSPERQLQMQDIRRYQDVRQQERTATRNVYRGSARPVQSIRRRKAKKRKAYIVRTLSVLLAVSCLILIYFMTGEIYRFTHDHSRKGTLQITSGKVTETDEGIAPPEMIEDLLEVNDFSRPGTELKRVKNVFVHYTANPGTSAAQNRSYFANLALTQERSASAHLIIGYDGELIQCIPFNEQAYAVMTRNEDSISIECCYVSEDGSFTQETYDTLVHTLAWLIDKYDLSAEDVLRHYDCGGKMCPLYYVEHEEAWNRLLEDVTAYKDAN